MNFLDRHLIVLEIKKKIKNAWADIRGAREGKASKDVIASFEGRLSTWHDALSLVEEFGDEKENKCVHDWVYSRIGYSNSIASYHNRICRKCGKHEEYECRHPVDEYPILVEKFKNKKESSNE